MDSIRKRIFPNATYSDEERDAAYRAFVLIAEFVSKAGKNVILDATGHKLIWRKLARKVCPRFVEIYVKCPVDVCIKRETNRKNNDLVRKKLYANALRRLRNNKRNLRLGKVPGIDEPYEESRSAELVIDSSIMGPKTLAELVLKKLNQYAPGIFC